MSVLLGEGGGGREKFRGFNSDRFHHLVFGKTIQSVLSRSNEDHAEPDVFDEIH